MHHASLTPQWSVPDVGLLRPCIDRVRIVSTASVGRLKNRLPIAAVAQASHRITIVTYRGRHPRLRSTVDLTCGQDLAALVMLNAHIPDLGRYSVVEAELAFDVLVDSIEDARARLFALAGQLGKRRHQRGFVRTVHQPNKTPPLGCTSEPSFYLEDRRSSVSLKCYARHQKLAAAGFGKLVIRLEWTLKGKAALVRHLGGNQINDLLAADLNAFLERNICLERADHLRLGRLFRRIKIGARSGRNPLEHRSVREQWADPDYRSVRAAFLTLRSLAYREENRFGDWDQALWACQNSPAQIRGYCRELRDGKRQIRRGRPRKPSSGRRRSITDYKINLCFHPVGLIRAPPVAG